MKTAFVSLSLVLTACLDPGDDLAHSAATSGCGPTDGRATVILLANDPIPSPTAPPDPYVRLTIDEDVSALAGRSWVVGPQSNAYAIYAFGRSVAQQATSGRVTISRVDANNRIEGIVQLHFPSRSISAGFNATWTESFVLCG